MFKPTKTIVAWDEKPDYKQNSRKEEFEEYKGNRSSDSSPHQNNEIIKLMLRYLGIPSVFPRELEADDVISYICMETDGEKVIISVDRDFLQLVNENVTLYDPIRKKEFRIDTFEEDTGWSHSSWLDAKCLLGDKSDNVPGVDGFGKAKIKKFFKGEVQLTEEQAEVYRRNLSLFSLDTFYSKPDEKKYYEEQLSINVTPDWSAFVGECKKRAFNSILKKREYWYSEFILKDKLQSLFS
jgi:5'-3' exonuclease